MAIPRWTSTPCSDATHQVLTPRYWPSTESGWFIQLQEAKIHLWCPLSQISNHEQGKRTSSRPKWRRIGGNRQLPRHSSEQHICLKCHRQSNQLWLRAIIMISMITDQAAKETLLDRTRRRLYDRWRDSGVGKSTMTMTMTRWRMAVMCSK